MKARNKFELAIDTTLLLHMFRKVKIGELITFEELGEVLKRPVNSADPYVQSAKRIAQKEMQTVFYSDHGIGYYRLSDEEITTKVPNKLVVSFRRSCKRGKKLLSYARDELLSNEAKIRRNTSMAYIGVIEQASKKSSQLGLEEKQRVSDTVLPIKDTLEFLRSREKSE